MKFVTFIFVSVCIVAVVSKEIPILEHREIHDEAGQYSVQYRTASGISKTEQGAFEVSRDGKKLALSQKGAYSYIGDDGKTYTVTYIADENGFQAFGDHIPQA